jgi:hypothetical protein
MVGAAAIPTIRSKDLSFKPTMRKFRAFDVVDQAIISFTDITMLEKYWEKQKGKQLYAHWIVGGNDWRYITHPSAVQEGICFFILPNRKISGEETRAFLSKFSTFMERQGETVLGGKRTRLEEEHILGPLNKRQIVKFVHDEEEIRYEGDDEEEY